MNFTNCTTIHKNCLKWAKTALPRPKAEALHRSKYDDTGGDDNGGDDIGGDDIGGCDTGGDDNGGDAIGGDDIGGDDIGGYNTGGDDTGGDDNGGDDISDYVRIPPDVKSGVGDVQEPK